MTFKELREQSLMSRKEFVDYFGIPYRTIQSWEIGDRQCPSYLLDLMEYKLNHDRHGEWLNELGDFRCSECHGVCEYTENYCPTCGAKMDK